MICNVRTSIAIAMVISLAGFPVRLLAQYKAHEALQNRYAHELGKKPLLKASPELVERINAITNHINSREWKERQHRHERELANDFAIAEEDQDTPEHQNSSANRQGKLVLFISSSMPEHVVNRYARDLSALNGVMVMRGGIGGIKKIKPTLGFIHRVLKKDRHCQSVDCGIYATDILIHPELFAANSITQVPALMMMPETGLNSGCRKENPHHHYPEADVVYGDATLARMIGALYKMTGDTRLEPYLEENHEK